MRHLLEFIPVWMLLQVMGSLPRPLAHRLGQGIGWLAYRTLGRLRRVGRRNLELAFPEMAAEARERLLRAEYDNLGRLLAEFCLFPAYTRENIRNFVGYEGLENYLAARARGRGVLLMTAHLGGWELGSFAHSLNGYPQRVVVRALDNPYLDRLSQRYRTLHGNRTFGKQEFARGLISAMRAGETVGVLMDTNMTPPQGVFVPFFGIEACTASGVARVALRTGAAVVPAFTVWHGEREGYRIHFEPALELMRTGDDNADARANTALFTRVIESYVRRYPEQWLWLHRRWKSRPPGEAPLY
jgi:KDO2-lipid IV(A) lauroyltransferase